MIDEFNRITGFPILVNTSFNVRGEPIVNTPKDAFNCFMGTELDYLVIGNSILDKKLQNNDLKKDYKKELAGHLDDEKSLDNINKNVFKKQNQIVLEICDFGTRGLGGPFSASESLIKKSP